MMCLPTLSKFDFNTFIDICSELSGFYRWWSLMAIIDNLALRALRNGCPDAVQSVVVLVQSKWKAGCFGTECASGLLIRFPLHRNGHRYGQKDQYSCCHQTNEKNIDFPANDAQYQLHFHRS